MSRLSSPKPYTPRQTSTTFLRVPSRYWVEVSRGYRREFRLARNKSGWFSRFDAPQAVVAYRFSRVHGWDCALMALESCWEEPLGAISPESLRAEGFDSLSAFRRDWVEHHGVRFEPMKLIYVFRVRPWEEADDYAMGVRLLERLYGDFLP